jgi:hypothetical protein
MIYEYRTEMRDIPRPFCSYDLPQYRQRNVVRESPHDRPDPQQAPLETACA